MYNIIEKEYKNKSPYNRVKLYVVLEYILLSILLILNNIYVKNVIASIILLIIMFVLAINVMKLIYEKALDTKLTINPFKKIATKQSNASSPTFSKSVPNRTNSQ